MDWKALANRILDGGEAITRDEALAVLNSSDGELLEEPFAHVDVQ